MRHEPYQAFDGEIFTMSRKGIHTIHQRRNGTIKRLTELTFDSRDEARAWVEPIAESLKVPGQRLFVLNDLDD